MSHHHSTGHGARGVGMAADLDSYRTSRPTESTPSTNQQSYSQSQSQSQVPKERLAPRSKTGCWTCRKRKVKCSEERPICNQCSRLGQVCDYEVKYNFKSANATVVGKTADLKGNPAWDPRTRKPRQASGGLDDTPNFTALSTEEDRERKATFHEPGRFYVVANQDSFASLPEYSQNSTRRSSSTADFSVSGSSHGAGTSRRTSRSKTARPSQGESDISIADEDTVILRQFEMPPDKPAALQRVSPPTSLAVRTRTSPTTQSHLPQHYGTSYASTSYANQPTRLNPQPQPTALDTSGFHYPSATTYSPPCYTPLSPQYQQLGQQPPQQSHSRYIQSHSQQQPQSQAPHPPQYPAAFQYAHYTPQPQEQYSPFSRLLPQPTLSTFAAPPGSTISNTSPHSSITSPHNQLHQSQYSMHAAPISASASGSTPSSTLSTGFPQHSHSLSQSTQSPLYHASPTSQTSYTPTYAQPTSYAGAYASSSSGAYTQGHTSSGAREYGPVPPRSDAMGGSAIGPAQMYDYAARPGASTDSGAAYGYGGSMGRYAPPGPEQTQGQGAHDDRTQEYGRYRRTGWEGR